MDIEWINNFQQNGYGRCGRRYVQILVNEGYNVKIIPSPPMKADDPMYPLTKNEVENPLQVYHAIPFRDFESYYTVTEVRQPPDNMAYHLKKANFIMTQSNFCKESFAKVTDREKIHVVNFPFPKQLHSPYGISFKSKLEKDYKFTFLTVARFDIRKNIKDMIKAFEEEFADNDDVALVLKIGSDRYCIRKIFYELGKPKNVYWMRQFVTDMSAVYRSFDAYVATDCGEGWGAPTTEAMLCFPAGQKVKTNAQKISKGLSGYKLKNIEDIHVGDEVLTDKRRFKKVTKVYKRKSNDFIRVTPYYQKEFVCTPNHPILTKNGWKSAKDLTKNDWIVKNKILKPKHITDIDIPVRNNKWWFLGFFLAEGTVYINKDKRKYRITVNTTDKEIAKKFDYIQVFDERYGNWRKISLNKYEKDGKYWFYFQSKTYAKFLQTFGTGAQNKSIRIDVFEHLKSNAHARKQFLKGYLKGDGNKHKNMYSLCSTSEKLLKQCKDLLECDGIFAKLTMTKAERTAEINGKSYRCAETFRLRWSENQKYVKKTNEKIYIKLKSVDKSILKDTEVYNIEVEDDHTYEIEQCIVHNCGIPTVMPNHSGHKMYANDKNSFLIDVGDWESIGYREDNLYQDLLQPQLEWKRPIFEDIKKKMRECYETFKDLNKEERLKHPMIQEALKIQDRVSMKSVGKQLIRALDWYEHKYR